LKTKKIITNGGFQPSDVWGGNSKPQNEHTNEQWTNNTTTQVEPQYHSGSCCLCATPIRVYWSRQYERLTCFNCKQATKDQENNDHDHDTQGLTPGNKQKNLDDETEHDRIIIAGEDSDDYQKEYWETDSEEEEDEDHKQEETTMTNNSQHLLPIVEPLQPHSELSPRMFLTPSPPTDFAFTIDSTRSDDLAFLIGHQDGLVQADIFNTLPEVNDKPLFSQNMQQMERRDHKHKLTK
jgi:hypothetical protein